MAKNNLANVTADLSALAAPMPTQRPVLVAQPSPISESMASAPVGPVMPEAGRTATTEEITQFSLSLRKGLRKQLGRLAADSDMTMRAFVLNALKLQGLEVRPDDLLDLRKDRR
jgi:hypothetical protein